MHRQALLYALLRSALTLNPSLAPGSLSAVEFAAFMQGQKAIPRRQFDDVGAAEAAAAGGDFAAASSGAGLPPLRDVSASSNALASEVAQLSKRFSAFEEATAAKLDKLLARMDHLPAEV